MPVPPAEASGSWGKAPAIGVFSAALVFYVLTLSPTITWGDSASLVTGAVSGPIRFATAGDHPLFQLLARVFTWLPGDDGRNVNLLAALFGALTVMLVFRIGRQLGASVAAAAIGAGALCVSHAFWFHAVIAEVYTANAFFLSATLTLLLDWRKTGRGRSLGAAAFVFFLGLSNHLVIGTAIPAVAIFVWLCATATFRRRVIVSVLVLVAGAGVVLLQPEALTFVRGVWYGPPGIGEYFDPRLDLRAVGVESAYYAAFLAYQFPSPALVLIAAGVITLWRRDRASAALLLTAWLVNAFVFVRHTVWPSATSMKFVFYIADYVILGVFCAIGVDALLKMWRASRRPWLRAVALGCSVVILPPALYAMMPALVERVGYPIVAARQLPYRDTARFFLNPNKRGDTGARRFGEEALRRAGPGAVIFADYTPLAVLDYLKTVEGQRPDVTLRTSTPTDLIVRVRREAGNTSPVYVAGTSADLYDFSELGRYELRPAGPLWLVARESE